MILSKLSILVLYLIGLILLASIGEGEHEDVLTISDATVEGHWGGYLVRSPSRAWDKNFNTYAWEVGMNNGIGDTFVVKYSWHKTRIKGDYTKIKSVTIFSKENSHCYPAVDYGYAYNFKQKKWVHGFTTSCGGTKTFSKQFNSDEFFNYSDNSVLVKLNAYNSFKQRLYELGVSEVRYWYNWFPRAEFTMPDRIYMNATVEDNATTWDPDGDRFNAASRWEYNGENISNISSVRLKIGDNMTHIIRACDPYNCTEIRHRIRVVNFIPVTRISCPDYTQGNKSLNISLRVLDLQVENQTHNVTCKLGNRTYSGRVRIDVNHWSTTTPGEEGNYTVKCTVCDGVNCTTKEKSIVVDNTPPKFMHLEIPRCTNLENLDWETNEPSRIILSSGTSGKNLTEGKALLCVRPVDRAGNIGEGKCENVTIDLTHPLVEYENGIIPPNKTFIVNATDRCGVRGTISYANNTCELNSPCSTEAMHRGNNTVLVNAIDSAGNRITKNITVRINLIPNVSITMPRLFADSDVICKYNVSNEPDQNYTVNKTILVNGKPYREDLKRGDNVTCIIKARDALNETGTATANTIVVNKPPDVKADYSPRFPSIKEKVHLTLADSDIDGDKITIYVKLENTTINVTNSTLPKQETPGNKTLVISAWDGYNWTNISMVIPYHLCGNGKRELGEECDGSAPHGYKCLGCRLIRVQHRHSYRGHSSWGGSTADIIPSETKDNSTGSAGNKSETPCVKNQNSSITPKAQMNITNNNTTYMYDGIAPINMTSNAVYRLSDQQTPLRLKTDKETSRASREAINELDRGVEFGDPRKSPGTAMISANADMLSIIVTLAILGIGLKNRRNIRRLSIRLKAMTTKMRSRKGNTPRRKDVL